MTPARLGNLIMAFIFATLVGCIFTLLQGCSVDPDFTYQAPSERCQGLSVVTCEAYAIPGDAGTD